MNKSIAFFFIALICVTFAYNNDALFLRSLKNQKFGKTLLQSIQLELSSGGNRVDKIINLLNEIRNSTTKEQLKATQDNDALQASKKATAEGLVKSIDGLNVKITQDKELIVLNKASIVQQQRVVEQQNLVVKTQTAALEVNRDTQKTDTDKYEKAFNQLSNQITALAEANQLINQLSSGTKGSSFIQLSNSIVNIRFQHPKYQSMINVLAQLLKPEIVSDQKLVGNIISIINKLQQQLRKELELLTSNFKIRIADLKIIESRLVFDIETAKGLVSEAEGKIANLELANVNAQQRITNNTQRVDESTLELNDVRKQAVDAQKAYDAATKTRNEEIQILDTVIAIFQNRFSEQVRAVVNSL